MNLKTQKRIAASLLKCSAKRVYFSPEHLEDIKEAITKQDIRELVNANVIQVLPKRGTSRARARKLQEQKRKGRRRGHGSRKGKKTARLPRKESWMRRIRAQRSLLSLLKSKGVLETKLYRELYRKAKGGFFRSVNHLKYYLKEKHNIENARKNT